MKYVCLLLVFSFFGCSSDDTKSTISPKLQGSYIMVDAELDSPIDYNGDGVASTQLREEVPACFTISMNLSKSFYLYSNTDWIEFDGTSYAFDCRRNLFYHGSWAQDGNVIIQHGVDGVTHREPFYFQGKDIVVERNDSIFGKMTIYFDRNSI